MYPSLSKALSFHIGLQMFRLSVSFAIVVVVFIRHKRVSPYRGRVQSIHKMLHRVCIQSVIPCLCMLYVIAFQVAACINYPSQTFFVPSRRQRRKKT